MKINSNISKEMVICFTPDENVRKSIPSIVIDGNIVETVEYAKLLGVTLSNDLTWNRHVDRIVKKKAAKRVYMLYQLTRAGISQLDLVSGLSRGVFWLPGNPPLRQRSFYSGVVTPLLAPTFTSHLHLRLLETPLETNSGYATAGDSVHKCCKTSF